MERLTEYHGGIAVIRDKSKHKEAALVAEATGESVTKAEFKALLDALKAAGIMASI